MVAQMIAQEPHKLRVVRANESDRVARYTENLVERWRTADPEWLARGMVWYETIHGEIKALATAAGVSMEMACGIAAVLSMDNSWRRNLLGLGEVLSAQKRGESCPKSAHRYGHVRAKVQAILDGADSEWVMDNYGKGSPSYKCKRFYRNLTGDLSCVTVDRHHWRMCEGTRDKSLQVPTGRAYVECETATIDAARTMGIEPAVFQAALWTEELREGAY